jgi:hypothetical protein
MQELVSSQVSMTAMFYMVGIIANIATALACVLMAAGYRQQIRDQQKSIHRLVLQVKAHSASEAQMVAARDEEQDEVAPQTDEPLPVKAKVVRVSTPAGMRRFRMFGLDPAEEESLTDSPAPDELTAKDVSND